jgi:hypothetical protein
LATKRLQLLPLVALVAAGCGGGKHTPERDVALPPQADVKAAVTKRCAAGAEQRIGSSREAYAAVVLKRAVAYRSPGGAALESFDRLNVNGVPTVLGILGARVDAGFAPAW